MKKSEYTIDTKATELNNYQPEEFGHAPLFAQEFSKTIFEERYKHFKDKHWDDTAKRVAETILCQAPERYQEFVKHLITTGIFIPAGRILKGAGSSLDVTLNNCYVSPRIEDSLKSIMEVLSKSAKTMSMGGGIGYDFSPIRPRGAFISSFQTGGAAGVVSFMKIFNEMCSTIERHGNRRGAQMGMLSCRHPEITEFIKAKSAAWNLTNFNVSIAITDTFMEAVENDDLWELWHHAPKYEKHRVEYRASNPVYVYDIISARDLWSLIMEHTYKYSEPGVFFIDQVNNSNPLNAIEYIRTTNPCGEQPLPANGICNLGAINLARLVQHPFSSKARFEFDHLTEAVKVGVTFLDSVIDVTRYPLGEQQAEAFSKRRIGLGVTGLADCLEFLSLKYDSDNGREFVSSLMHKIKSQAQEQSILLGITRGIPVRLRKEEFKRRNGVLLTVAPVGTTSIVVGNVSSGIEPIFAPHMKRSFGTPEGGTREVDVYDYAEYMRKRLNTSQGLYNTLSHISLEGHIKMLSTVQQHVDASVSKTINVPEDIPFEEFKEVYVNAYKLNCKSVTTYRPSEVRGQIITKSTESTESTSAKVSTTSTTPVARDEVLYGQTYKIQWPEPEENIYVTINFKGATPHEVFISSAESGEFMKALGIMISRRLQNGDSVNVISKDLSSIYGDSTGRWIKGRWFSSKVSAIGHTLERAHKMMITSEETGIDGLNVLMTNHGQANRGCPKCSTPLVKIEGCETCPSCDYSKCD